MSILSSVFVPIMKIMKDHTFGYSSGYWTNDNLLNEKSELSEKVNAKYSSFLSQPFTMIRMCTKGPNTDCIVHTFDHEWENAKQLFNAGYIRAPSMDQAGMLRIFGPEKGAYAVSVKEKTS